MSRIHYKVWVSFAYFCSLFTVKTYKQMIILTLDEGKAWKTICHWYWYIMAWFNLTATEDVPKNSPSHNKQRSILPKRPLSNSFDIFQAATLLIAFKTRLSTRRAQTFFAEANHYPYIVQYGQYVLIDVGPWWWKASGTLPESWSGHAKTISEFFAHLFISQGPDRHQNVISSSLYHPGPLHKFSLQSVNNYLSNASSKQTN